MHEVTEYGHGCGTYFVCTRTLYQFTLMQPSRKKEVFLTPASFHPGCAQPCVKYRLLATSQR
jgi:hypothetical protein